MQYENSSERTTIIPQQLTCLSTGDTLEESFEIRCIKRQIIILISIELIIMTIYFIVQMINLILYETQMNKINTSILTESFITLISIVYLISFLISITQYFPCAIFPFIWLTLIQLIGGLILLPLAIMAIITSLTLIKSVGAEIIIDIIFVITGISIIVLSVLIIIYLLHLMKLMKK